MQNNLLSGSLYFYKGITFIFKPGIRRWVIIPFLINIFLFSGLIYYGWLQFQVIIDIVMPYVQSVLPDWEWLIDIVRLLMWFLFMAIAMTVFFLTFTFVGNFIGGPFNGLLAAAVESHLTGKVVESKAEPWYKFFINILWSPIEKLLYYLFWVMVLLIISLLPVINLISPVLWFIFTAWFVTLEYADAPMGNNGKKAPGIRKILAKRRMLTFGFGSSVVVTMFIPVINLLVMPIAVAGATCMWVYEFKDEQ